MKTAIVLVITIIIACVYYGAKEQAEWERFALAHKCKVIQKSKGRYIHGFGSSFVGGQYGSHTTGYYQPDRTAYVCDDGVTYWR